MKGKEEKNMMTHRQKQRPVIHKIRIFGVTAIITCLFLIGIRSFSLLGFVPSAFAHAEGNSTTIQLRQIQSVCVSNPTDQHCTQQDPIMQGCSRDAQTIAYREMRTRENTLIGLVERRYSALCHSEWGRITNYEQGNHPVTITIGHDPGRSSSGKVAYSLMVFVPTLSVAPEITGEIAIATVSSTQGGPTEGINIPAEPAPSL